MSEDLTELDEILDELEEEWNEHDPKKDMIKDGNYTFELMELFFEKQKRTRDGVQVQTPCCVMEFACMDDEYENKTIKNVFDLKHEVSMAIFRRTVTAMGLDSSMPLKELAVALQNCVSNTYKCGIKNNESGGRIFTNIYVNGPA